MSHPATYNSLLTGASGAYPPLPQSHSPGLQYNDALQPPQARFAGEPVIRDSYVSSQQSHHGSETDSALGGRYRDNPDDGAVLPLAPVDPSRGYGQEKNAVHTPPRNRPARKIIIIIGIVALIVVLLAVVLPVYFMVIKPGQDQGSETVKVIVDGNGQTQTVTEGARPTSNPSVRVAVTGTQGSEITMEDGTTFTYENSFGGHWYYDEFDPLNQGARANSWTPALNETYDYSTDKMMGVNLGGWLVIEPFISPALFEKYSSNPVPPVDEWTLSVAMRADAAGGGINQLEEHYKTFITEKDFAEIAAAGLNWVRIPIAWWAIETRGNEPHLAGVSWTYFLKAIKWARKYGLRINLDLHALPGSMNGWNHSGKMGSGINILNGPMGYANAERALDYMRIFAQFISQPEYKDVVPVFGIMNEPRGSFMGQTNLKRFYKRAYDIIRTAGGTGEGNGPYIVYHDGFFDLEDAWAGFLPNADRIGLDTHQYMSFDPQPNGNPMSSYVNTPCERWAPMMNKSMADFGHTNAGEYSNAVTDCGYLLNGVGMGARYEGTFVEVTQRVGSCSLYRDYDVWDQAMKDAMMGFALSAMDAMRNFFFWTWKIGVSDVHGKVQAPDWSYQLGLQNGWMPKDPRTAFGRCQNTNPWTPPLKPWQTGGAGAGDIAPSIAESFAWPPASITNAGFIDVIPSYTATGLVPTLTAPPFAVTQTGVSASIKGSPGDGWNNPSDTVGMMVEVSNCAYLDPWIGPTAAVPAPLCTAGAKREEAFLRFRREAILSFATPVPFP